MIDPAALRALSERLEVRAVTLQTVAENSEVRRIICDRDRDPMWLARCGAEAGRRGNAALDLREAAAALTVLLDGMWCSQCGQPVWRQACGPSHAVRFAELDDAIGGAPAAPEGE